MLFNLLWRFAVVAMLLGAGVANFAAWNADDRSGQAVMRRSIVGGIIGILVGLVAGFIFYTSAPHHPVH
ncbi:MAG: hypothetical protein K6T76_12545 [Alicyclobacillus mali]|uniref:hypothetical protein n=1 Tax=Alicyclobacillus mali (ex Roth et al. 2021) TaxID=1123961 RepID=UPI0023F4EA59|nr:hypothetical protein [Alicyclobacillus mali (ex Roth et al. 2021)]MCL6489745.1 hypothetical protein [Alicyclobacillus mali (ex Roth et al. 2021)]